MSRQLERLLNFSLRHLGYGMDRPYTYDSPLFLFPYSILALYPRLISAFGGYTSSALDKPSGMDMHMSVWPLRKKKVRPEELKLLNTVLYAS